MAITVTTFPELDANGYVSLVTFKAYCDELLKTYAGKTDDEIAAAIITATTYMDVRFKFKGRRKLSTQRREWPRDYVYDDHGYKIEDIPFEVSDACCEYAFRALSMNLMADPTQDSSGRPVKSKDEKVGPISESVTYDVIAGGYELPAYPFADRMLYRRNLVCRPSGISVGNVGRS